MYLRPVFLGVGGSIFTVCMCTMLFFMAASGQGGTAIKLPQNLRNIWIVPVFFISLINISQKYCFGLSKMVMSLLHLDQILWGNDSLFTFFFCIQSLK